MYLWNLSNSVQTLNSINFLFSFLTSKEEPAEFGIKTRKKKTNRAGGFRTRGNVDEDAATNRLTRRALYDTDEEASLTRIFIPSFLFRLCAEVFM